MADRVARTAAVGFDQGAAAYEAGRPSYPADAVDWLVEGLDISPGQRVLDLAAGTGKFTRLLVPTGAQLAAVEPVAGMRNQFAANLPDIPVFDGTAERIPAEDNSVDAITVAQAFHWFDLAASVSEIRRVLCPGGGLGLIFNERDTSEEWVAELSSIIRWDERGRWQVPYTVEVDWAQRFDTASSGFTPMETYHSSHVQDLDVDTLVARVLSTSYIAASDAESQARVAERVRELAATFPPRFELPYVTVAYRCHRI